MTSSTYPKLYQHQCGDAVSSRRSLTGKPVVLGMFLFAMIVSLGLWGYWKLHTEPFRALTDKLAESFPGSNPRVEGGKHGMHKQTPSILRIVMRVPYNPNLNDRKYKRQLRKILEITSQSGMLATYDLCEIHLFCQPAERTPEIRSLKIPAAEFPQRQTPSEK